MNIRFILCLLILNFSISTYSSNKSSNMRLWYKSPAKSWMTEALPLGNGLIGAMIFGGIEREHIQFNEKSLWSGKVEELQDLNFYDRISKVQNLLLNGNIVEAHELLNDFSVPRENFGSFQPFGDIYLDFEHNGTARNYTRDLNLEDGIANVDYSVGDVEFHRECFVSYPDQVLVLRVSSSKKSQLNVLLSTEAAQEGSFIEVQNNDEIVQYGKMPLSGLRYASRLKVKVEGGVLKRLKNKIQILNANSFIVYLSATTNYKMKWPKCMDDSDPIELTNKIIKKAYSKNYFDLIDNHKKRLSTTI